MARNDDDEPEERALIDEAEFGRIAIMEAGLSVYREIHNKELNGPLRLIMLQAKADAIVAVEELVKADAADAARIRELQWAVSRYEALYVYAAEIIEKGRQVNDDLSDVDRLKLEADMAPDT